MPRREDPTARGRILEAASRLFYERGVNGVGLAEVVTVAGTGRNVLYRHFPGKDELVLSYLQRFAERIDATVEARVEKLPPDQAIAAVARHVGELVCQPGYRGCPFRNYLRETRDVEGPAGQFALDRVRRLRREIKDLVVDHGVPNSEVVSTRIWLVLEGMYASTPYPDRAAVTEAGIRHIESLIAQTALGSP